MPPDEPKELIQPPPQVADTGGGDIPPLPAADPLKDMEARFTETLKKQREEILNELRRPIPSAPAPTSQPVDPYNESLDAEFFSAPHKVLRRVKEEAVKEAEEKLTKQYRAAQEVDTFWNNFYRSNPQFDRGKDHALIETVAQANMHNFRGKDGREQADILSKAANELLLDITQRHSKRNENEPSLKIEPASPSNRKTAVQKEPVILTFAQSLKKRQQARAEAMSKRITKESA